MNGFLIPANSKPGAEDVANKPTAIVPQIPFKQ